MINKLKIGLLGENIAARYLMERGYKIIYRNYRLGFDEIDIVGSLFNKKLIFFEVKTLNIPSANYPFMPEDHFSYLKAKKVRRAAHKFAGRHPDLLDEDQGWQVDLIAVLLKGGERFDLRHYKNV